MSNITSREFGRRFRKALSVPFSLNQVCSTQVKDFVTLYAASIGCTEKALFFPLMTCTAACMGNDTHIELREEWFEPPILWTMVLTPSSLHRIDVAEHLKKIFLEVQNEVWSSKKDEDTKDFLKKFIYDKFTLDQFLEMLKFSNGHGLIIYNSALYFHDIVKSPKETAEMMKLLYGYSWFTDSRVNKNTLTKTRVNFTAISTPIDVHQTITTTTYFLPLFQQGFLTACAEENHVKFGQLSKPSQRAKLKQLFISLMELHFSGTPIIYKFSTEALEKFEQIHDELTDKAKQMARKNAHKVFQPALAYLGRLSCILHVLDNAIEALNWNMPLDPITWNAEISAASVWHARELLGHIIEQRHALMEQTTIDPSQQKSPRAPSIDLDGEPSGTLSSFHLTPQTPVNRRNGQNYTHSSNINNTPSHIQKTSNSFLNNVRRNLNLSQTPSNNAFDSLLTQSDNTSTSTEPLIVSLRSAGLPVSNNETSFNPIITSCSSLNSVENGIPKELNLPSSLSVSLTDQTSSSNAPPLLSREPVFVEPMTDEEFLKSYRTSLRKLLTLNVNQITASRCVNLKLTPDPLVNNAPQKYTPSFARYFLKKLELLGFGVCPSPNNNNLRNFLFKKRKFSALGERQKQILNNLKVNEREYNKCFNNIQRNTNVNGVVCLE